MLTVRHNHRIEISPLERPAIEEDYQTKRTPGRSVTPKKRTQDGSDDRKKRTPGQRGHQESVTLKKRMPGREQR